MVKPASCLQFIFTSTPNNVILYLLSYGQCPIREGNPLELKKAIEAALRLISYHQPEVKNSYHLRRKLGQLGRLSLIRAISPTENLHVVCREQVIPVRMFYPGDKVQNTDLLLFFHGGGWVTGDIDSYNKVCAVTALKTGCRVASVDYRLAPEHKFPKGLQDCYEIAQYFFKNAMHLFGISPERIVLMGDSAGGNLAAAVSLMARDRQTFVPKRQILIYPATYNDHTENSPYPSVEKNGKDYVLTSQRIVEYMSLYMRTPKDAKSPYFAPLLAEDFSAQPDTLVITAEFDPLRDEGEDYGQHLRSAGNPVEIYRISGAIHGFFSMPAGLPQVKQAYQIMNQFLSEAEHGEIKETHRLDPA